MVSGFCQICKVTDKDGRAFRYVHATLKDGALVYEKSSSASICVCSNCKVPGEPEATK